MMEHPWHEEILEHVFTEREEGRDAADAVLAATPGRPGPEKLLELARLGYVRVDEGRLHMTSEGERLAREVVRRHRLAERLMAGLLGLGETAAEESACELEHILSPEATSALCTFLGHPATCPHGKPIPRGECCEGREKALLPLAASALGAEVRVLFIAPQRKERLVRLAALGVVPGSKVKLVQRRPSCVVEVGATLLALDPEVAEDVFVERA
jgi:DtxR family Mn-dependent transcriptional regulator